MKKIVIVTPTLYEENSPFNRLLKDILMGFLDSGLDITRIVAVENDNDESFKLGLDSINYIKIKRKRIKKTSFVKRYIYDVLTAIKMSKVLKRGKYDVLFEDVTYCSPLVVKAAKKSNLKVVSMFQDIWPDNAVNSGLLSNKSIVYKFFKLVQKKVYLFSDKYISISDDMGDYLSNFFKNNSKGIVIYNWSDNICTNEIKWDENLFVKKYDLDKNCFYVIYAGNIGVMQNVENIIKSASLLQNNNKIHFLIVGDGSRKKEIESMCDGLKNVTLLPFQSKELARHVYSAAGVNIISLVDGGINTAFPSKTPFCISCKKPIIFATGIKKNLTKIVKEYNIGVCIESNNPVELASTIEYYSKEKKFESNCDILTDFFDKEKNIKKYVEAIRE